MFAASLVYLLKGFLGSEPHQRQINKKTDFVVLGGPSIGTIPNMVRTNAKTITAAITFAGTENGITAGPVTFSGSGSVTVTTGSTWHLLV